MAAVQVTLNLTATDTGNDTWTSSGEFDVSESQDYRCTCNISPSLSPFPAASPTIVTTSGMSGSGSAVPYVCAVPTPSSTQVQVVVTVPAPTMGWPGNSLNLTIFIKYIKGQVPA